jgi:hypothetical protein
MTDEYIENEAEDDLPSLPVLTPRDRYGPDDPWPMEWHSAPVQRLVLPNLGDTDDGKTEAAFFPTKPVSSSTRSSLQENLSVAA